MLLLDEPAAGVPQEESGEIFEVVAELSNDLTLLFIEHDMHVVFRFATHIIVLVGGAIFTEGSPAEIAADPRRARSLSGDAQTWLTAWLSRCSRSTTSRAGYGDAVVLHGVSLDMPEHGSLAVLGRNGVGKSTLLLTIMGYTQMRGGRVLWRGTGHLAHAAASPRAATASAGWRRSARFSRR